MIFNGHTPDTIANLDELTFGKIQTMYADGMIGNNGVLSALGVLTAGVFNYIRPANSSAYKLENIIGRAHDYIYPPLTEQEKKKQVNKSLFSYVSQAPGYSMEKFKNG